jgi:hypothetical protein
MFLEARVSTEKNNNENDVSNIVVARTSIIDFITSTCTINT